MTSFRSGHFVRDTPSEIKKTYIEMCLLEYVGSEHTFELLKNLCKVKKTLISSFVYDILEYEC